MSISLELHCGSDCNDREQGQLLLSLMKDSNYNHLNFSLVTELSDEFLDASVGEYLRRTLKNKLSWSGFTDIDLRYKFMKYIAKVCGERIEKDKRFAEGIRRFLDE